MQPLRPAGIFARIVSHFFPRKLTAHLRAEILPNGQVELTPVFTVDGLAVDGEQIGDGKAQKIFGHSVELDEVALVARRETHGRRTVLAKSKAARFLDSLSERGVNVFAKDGRTPLQITDVRPEVCLTLTPDDRLIVESELTTPEGVVVGKPSDLRKLRDEGGWFAVGADLYRVETTGTPADGAIFGNQSPTTLAGDSVPQFLKAFDAHRDKFGDIERNDALSGLSVYGAAQPRVRVDGDEETIAVATGLVFPTRDGSGYEPDDGELKSYRERGGGYRLEPSRSISSCRRGQSKRRSSSGRLGRRRWPIMSSALTQMGLRT
jgi:hypothetical protein